MWADSDTAIGGDRDRFPSTQVSLIEAAAGEPLAMERVAALYWKPVYKFIRFKFRKDNEAAKDLTQGFFASALEREFFQRFDPSKAAFRTYLRLAVERFAANQHEAENRQKRGGGVEFRELDDQAASTESPEEIFLQEWRRQLFALAIEDLRAECARDGKGTEWSVFEAYDLAEDDAAILRRTGAAARSGGNIGDQLPGVGAPQAAGFRDRAAARRNFRRARTARGDAAPVELSDLVLHHLREVVDLPDLAGTRYELGEEIGRGGLGVVYAARDTQLDRRVALKVMDAAWAGEARLIARLEHPGIVPVYETGTLPDGRVFYAMKLVAGVRADRYVARQSAAGRAIARGTPRGRSAGVRAQLRSAASRS